MVGQLAPESAAGLAEIRSLGHKLPELGVASSCNRPRVAYHNVLAKNKWYPPALPVGTQVPASRLTDFYF